MASIWYCILFIPMRIQLRYRRSGYHQCRYEYRGYGPKNSRFSEAYVWARGGHTRHNGHGYPGYGSLPGIFLQNIYGSPSELVLSTDEW
ncbi:hypothetical protein Pmar_PMAR024423, partial [Perkinsus marinus ATCC 50983]